MQQIPVLICGAGPVGLSLSLALSRLGIENIVLEKHPGTSVHPKARGINVRTMEIFRQWGIEEAIRQHELPEETRRLLWVENIHGQVIGEVSFQHIAKPISPTTNCLVTQNYIEQELVNALRGYDESTILFATKLVSIEQDAKGVNCELQNKDSGKKEWVRAQYVVAADGSHSFVREALNISMQGNPTLGDYLSVYCEVDLLPTLQGKLATVMAFTDKDQRGKFIMADDLKKKWVIAQRLREPTASIDETYCMNLVRSVAKSADIPVNIINVSIWQMAALNAERYRCGRVFLAGDAAHRLPPTGGMGLNTGVQDAHNLAWKLAYVINDYADSKLLNSYEAERKPLAQFTIDWSTANAKRIFTMVQALEKNDLITFKEKLVLQEKQGNHPGLDLGFVYRSGAVYGSSECAELDPDHYCPSFEVGGRFPHFIAEINHKPQSILNHFEAKHVLLVSHQEEQNEIYKKSPLPETFPVMMIQINSPEIAHYKALLVRPDGHIAWCLAAEPRSAT